MSDNLARLLHLLGRHQWSAWRVTFRDGMRIQVRHCMICGKEKGFSMAWNVKGSATTTPPHEEK